MPPISLFLVHTIVIATTFLNVPLKEVSGVRPEENSLMNVGVVGLQEPRISVTLYTCETYLLSATQTPTQRSDRSYVRNAPF